MPVDVDRDLASDCGTSSVRGGRSGEEVAREERQSPRRRGACACSQSNPPRLDAHSLGAVDAHHALDVVHRKVVTGQDDGPEPEGEVAILRLAQHGAPPLAEHRVAADLPLGAEHRGKSRKQRERGVSRRDFDRRPHDRGRVREGERAFLVEDPDRRRMEDGRQQPHALERIDGVLPRGAAAREERLQRLGREVHDVVVLDPADPPALHRVVDGMEHAEPHQSATARCGRRRRRSREPRSAPAPPPRSRGRGRRRASRRGRERA